MRNLTAAQVQEFVDFDTELTRFTSSREVVNSSGLLMSFFRAFLASKTPEELLRKRDIYLEHARRPFAALAESARNTYGSCLKKLASTDTLLFFQSTLDIDSHEDRLAAIQAASLSEEQRPIFLSVNTGLKTVYQIIKINPLLDKLASYQLAILQVAEAFDEALNLAVCKKSQEKCHANLLKTLGARNSIGGFMRSTLEDYLVLISSLEDSELAEMVKLHWAEFESFYIEKSALLELKLADHSFHLNQNITSNRTAAEDLLKKILGLQGRPESFQAIFSEISRSEKSERIKAFRKLAHAACTPRNLRVEDFTSRSISNKYELKAKLFFLFLNENPVYASLIDSDEDLPTWFSNPENIFIFNEMVKFIFANIQEPNEFFSPDFIVELRDSATQFIEERRLPITPLQLFAPTVSYAKTEAADEICLFLAANPSLQRYLLGHEGETDLSVDQIRSWLLDNQKQLEAEDDETLGISYN